MNNPPFSIGQKVVYLDKVNGTFQGFTPKIKKGDVVRVVFLSYEKAWRIKNVSEWFIETDAHLGVMYLAEDFAPIITNYSDATSEILEKFKSPAETPDKILTPEKVTNQ